MPLVDLGSFQNWDFHPSQVGGIRKLVDILTGNFPVNATTVTSFVYDGSNRLTQFIADGNLCLIDYPTATQINVSYLGKIRQITLDGGGRITGISTL